MNPSAEKLTGWPLEEALGRQLPEVFHIISAHSRERETNPAEKVWRKGRSSDWPIIPCSSIDKE